MMNTPRTRRQPQRFAEETFLPGANNGHTVGREVDMGHPADLPDPECDLDGGITHATVRASLMRLVEAGEVEWIKGATPEEDTFQYKKCTREEDDGEEPDYGDEPDDGEEEWDSEEEEEGEEDEEEEDGEEEEEEEPGEEGEEEWDSEGEERDEQCHRTVTVPNDAVLLVLGHRGRTVKAFARQVGEGCQITHTPYTGEFNIVADTPAAVLRAEELILGYVSPDDTGVLDTTAGFSGLNLGSPANRPHLQLTGDPSPDFARRVGGVPPRKRARHHQE